MQLTTFIADKRHYVNLTTPFSSDESRTFRLTLYSYGVRFNELRHLQTVDFSRNPHAPEFGRYGVVRVRYGKAKKGSPPKRRTVLTVFDWTPEIISDWLTYGQPYLDDGIDLFPSERGALCNALSQFQVQLVIFDVIMTTCDVSVSRSLPIPAFLDREVRWAMRLAMGGDRPPSTPVPGAAVS